jgi:pimeloyl-ACP methyl ester carboxylesterase
MQERQAVEQHLIATTGAATKVGVVFVHGIGQQSESYTVREFGGPILHWLQEWHKRRDQNLCVSSADLTYGELAQRPARFKLDLEEDGEHPAQTWFFAEAWWAARLSAPNLDEMTWWGLKSAVVRCLRLAEVVVDSFRKLPQSPKAIIEVVSSLLLFLGYVAAAILSIPLILGLYVLAQIPGPVERAVMGLRNFVQDQIGDFYTFMWDDIQAVHVRGSVAAAIRFLLDKGGCERIAVIAHSQGTVVAYDALCSDAVPPADLARVKTFITFGSALNNAWDKRLVPARTCRLKDPLPETIRWINVWSAYDPVTGGAIKTPDRRAADDKAIRAPDEDLEVTNGMNVILDHGGYFTNREEFLSRLAQELESPGDRQSSRFFPADGEKRWSDRRRDRVLTLVTWRVVAMLAFAVGVIARVLASDRLRADGEAVWAWLMTLPIVGGAVMFIDQHALWLAWTERLGARVLGIGFWLVVLGVAYVGISWLAFVPWHDNAGQRSAGTGRPPASQRAIIVASSLAMFFAIAVGIIVMIQAPALRRP